MRSTLTCKNQCLWIYLVSLRYICTYFGKTNLPLCISIDPWIPLANDKKCTFRCVSVWAHLERLGCDEFISAFRVSRKDEICWMLDIFKSWLGQLERASLNWCWPWLSQKMMTYQKFDPALTIWQAPFFLREYRMCQKITIRVKANNITYVLFYGLNRFYSKVII